MKKWDGVSLPDGWVEKYDSDIEALTWEDAKRELFLTIARDGGWTVDTYRCTRLPELMDALERRAQEIWGVEA